MFLGLKDIFINALSLWCTQHLQKADARKLHEMGLNEKNKSKILASIYGSQTEISLEKGLADAEDEVDFNIKLESLESTWESLIPGFHAWFGNKRGDVFRESLILSARDSLGISGRYTTNGLELKHKLQKKKINEANIVAEVSAVSEVLKKWVEENFFAESVRALRGFGKYHLAPGYEEFKVDPLTWTQWSTERKQQHIDVFNNFVPKPKYVKPAGAGQKPKPGSNKRRATLPEPELFSDRIEIEDNQEKQVTPIKVKITARDSGSGYKVICFLFRNFEEKQILQKFRGKSKLLFCKLKGDWIF